MYATSTGSENLLYVLFNFVSRQHAINMISEDSRMRLSLLVQVPDQLRDQPTSVCAQSNNYQCLFNMIMVIIFLIVIYVCYYWKKSVKIMSSCYYYRPQHQTIRS